MVENISYAVRKKRLLAGELGGGGHGPQCPPSGSGPVYN